MTLSISSINKYPKSYGVNINHDNSAAKKTFVTNPKIVLANNISFSGIINKEPKFLPLRIIEKYINTETVKNALDTNPNITRILKEHGIKPKISAKNINDKLQNHLFTTYLYAKEIADQSNLSQKSKETLYKAALLHDIGKALIPEKIVQKPGKLTESEREIINLHAELGYEILKTTDVEKDVLEAVRLHHVPAEKKEKNKIAQILSVADVFSALKEKRSYKSAMSDVQAFSIMKNAPYLSQKYVGTLCACYI